MAGPLDGLAAVRPGVCLGWAMGQCAGMVTPVDRQRLQDLRESLLILHKTLVESERAGYEATFGHGVSPHRLFQLLTADPWFAWLRPLSRLIVSIDEALDEKEPLTGERVAALVRSTRDMLVASEEGDGFPRSYFEALQRDPDVVFAHARAAGIFRAR